MSPLLLYLLTLSSNSSYQIHSLYIKKHFKIHLPKPKQKMSLKSKTSMVVAASISAVEALKDQAGLCRWNYALRSINQRAKNNAFCSLGRSEVRDNNYNSRSLASVANKTRRSEQKKKSEESLRTIMFLSNWGPN
ncbi:hypothetical protein LUZ60_017435 [Juncus effusus]|nr:hypothetical protein LUZ60_017435 [Juncus effusus]